MNISASGAVVDAFTLSLQTPGAFSSSPSNAQNLVIAVGDDFVTTWAQDVYPGEVVRLYMVLTPGSRVINCVELDAAERLTIPAVLLANGQTGEAVITNVVRSNERTAVTTNATIYGSASTLITWNGTLQ